MSVLIQDENNLSIANMDFHFFIEEQSTSNEETFFEQAQFHDPSMEQENSSVAATKQEGAIEKGPLLRSVKKYGVGVAIVFLGLYGSQGYLVNFPGMLPPSFSGVEGTPGSVYDPRVLFLAGTQEQETNLGSAEQALADLSSLVDGIRSLRTLTVSEGTWKLADAAAESVSSHKLTESEIEEWATRIAISVSEVVD